MSNWRLHPLMGMLLAGACNMALAGTSTIYYYTPYKNWSTVYVHHNGSGTWTTAPGALMDAGCTSWKSKTITSPATSFQAVFTNGAGAWDNLNNTSGSNYTIPAGVHQVRNGQLLANAGSPCAPADMTAPSVPTSLIKGTVTASSVALSWAASTDNVGVVRYEIYRSGVLSGTSTTTSYTATGLAASTAYSFTVLAVDAAGNKSAQSTAVSATTASGNSATVFYRPNTSWTTVNIHYQPTGGSWTAVPGVAMDAACTGWRKKTISLGTATGLAAAFNNGSTWDSRNGANYAIGTGTFKVENSTVVAGDPCGAVDITAPTVPTALVKGAVTASSIALSWTASTDASGIRLYSVYRNGVLVGTSTTASYTDTGLAASTTYSYTVIAEDNAGNRSTASAALSAATSGTVNQQAKVYYYTTTRGWSSTYIHYTPTGGTWTAAPGVVMGETACNGWALKTVDLGAATGLTAAFNNGSGVWDSNVNSSNYALQAGVSTVRDGVVTNNAAVPCVVDNTPPTTPGTLSGSASGTVVTLNWGASTDNSGSVSYVVTRTGGAGTVSFTAPGNNLSDSSGAPFTAYSYSVRAKDPSGNLSTSASNVASVTTGAQTVTSSTFSWDNATVYFLLNDRFANGDTSNDRSYGRESTQAGVPFNNTLTDFPATFHGGDLKGITAKINADYFSNLGVNAIWITAPYEQIHGFVDGGGYKHYAYHGYYALDFSTIDKNMGTKADLIALVDAAHAKGIRVVMDVVMNHPGYDALKDMSEYGFGTLNSGWESTAFKTDNAVNYDTHIRPYFGTSDATAWGKWWGSDWLRVGNGLAGYSACSGTDGLLGCVGYLPDFRTDNGSAVGLPPILNTKWTREGRLASETASLDAWFSRTGRPRIVPNYIVKWLTDYVRDTGIDGFRADTVKHVELNHWKTLKDEAVRARNDWIAANPTKAAQLKGDTAFWMTGEHWNHGTERDAYFDYGFDSMINFNFQGVAGSLGTIDSTYVTLAGVNANNSQVYNLLSYISSHDKGLFDRNNLKNGITGLMMAPGGVQVYYGDESKRPALPCCGDHVSRSSMNWTSTDAALLAHAQKLGKFRNAHVAVGAGSHSKLADAPYTFARVKGTDKVVVAFNASGTVAISVGSTFAEGSRVKDAYTGQIVTVTGGRATVTADSNGVVLLEQAP